MSGLSLLTRGYVRGLSISQAAQAVPMVPVESQAILVRALELPLPAELTEIKGIHQSDVIIRSALEASIQDLRANPYLLDYVFASLPQDPLTWKEYGERSVAEAKAWFLKTKIPVRITPVLNELQLPAISITLQSSEEAVNEATTADTHHDPWEYSDDSDWPALTSPFTPKSYLPGTGVVTLDPATVTSDLLIVEGMFLIDAVGRSHEILEVLADNQFRISAGTVANLRNAVIKPAKPVHVTAVESSSFRETYRIGVHVGGEPVKLAWLHSVAVFCLLRYKEALLEARGFERSTVGSSDFSRDQSHEVEMVFSRFITVSGFVRQYWPKLTAPTVQATELVVRVDGATDSPEDPDTQLWVGENDVLTGRRG